MPVYIEYSLDDNTTVLIEAPDDLAASVPVKASAVGERVLKAQKSFDEALESALVSAEAALEKFKILDADEVKLTFGLETTGELGNFAIGKLGVTANYEVTLKWKNKLEEKPVESPRSKI